MQTHRNIRCCVLTVALAFSAAAFAQTPKFPATPVRLVIPFSGGSQTDMLGRLVGQKLGEQWSQQVVIDNRPSAGGTIAAQIVATSNPDGHTLFVHSSGFAISPWLYSKMLQVDMKRDFHAITILGIAP